MSPRESLEGLAPTTKDRVKVVVGGTTFLVRTRLKVKDVMGFPRDLFQLHPYAANCVLFRFLALSENGLPFIDDDDDQWFNSVDAMEIHRGMEAAGVLEKLFDQLRPADSEAAPVEGKLAAA